MIEVDSLIHLPAVDGYTLDDAVDTLLGEDDGGRGALMYSLQLRINGASFMDIAEKFNVTETDAKEMVKKAVEIALG